MMPRPAWSRWVAFAAFFAVLGAAAPSLFAQQTILMVTANDGSLTSEESARRSSFQSWGYTVTTIWDDASQTEYNNALASADLAYVPEDANGNSVGTKLRLATIGVVVEESRLDVEFGFSDTDGSERSATQIYVVDGGYNVTIVSSTQPLTQMNGTLAPGLVIVGRTSSTGPVTVATLETGAALANTLLSNSNAAGRRVRLPFGGNSFQWSSLNSTGQYIVQQALLYAAPASAELELHWQLDEGSGTSLSDVSGNNRHGSFQTGSPTWTTGPRDGALDFNGANNVRSNATFNPPERGTVAFWMKRDDSVSGTERILGTADNWEIYIGSDGRVGFDLGATGTTSGFVTNSSLNVVNRWYHVVGVYDAVDDTYAIYIDGQLHKTGSYNLADQGANYLSLGTRNGSSERFDGTIDDLRIYSYELDAEEVAELHGLVGHWKFDEGSGSVAADSTAFGNDATISGATWATDCAGNTTLSFDGSGDRAETGSNFDPPSEGTIAFWFLSTNPAAGHQRLWGVGGDYEMRQTTDGVVYCDVASNATSNGFYSEPFAGAKWYHFVAVYDSDDDTYAIYVDGELQKSASGSLSPQSANRLTFGTRTGSSEYWQGSMRDFRIYNRQILESEILELAGVIAHYELDETSGSIAYDSSLAGNHATYMGAPTLGVGGPSSSELGTAVELDGSMQYVTSGKSLLNGLNQFTMAGWIYFDSLTANRSFFGQNDVIEFGINGAEGQIHLWTANGGSSYVAGTLSAGRWVHLAAVGDGSSISIYVDGTLVHMGGNSIGSGTYGSSSYPFIMGEGVYSASGDYLDGRVDDVHVYSRALCASEIQDLATAGLSTQGVRILRWTEIQ
ncbi:LamG domain-containing protein [Bremerella sp. P1]|uniref:LamG domain-containing protein n=1 Tax=Bremerella sp. P1 TaxID=3026424 RepID=UPI0023677160|nr:LamG domain-containing protein [Bremerella sp. P1]WDI43169.1 LamG domain-containing protein [Bremerella sp. P1]